MSVEDLNSAGDYCYATGKYNEMIRVYTDAVSKGSTHAMRMLAVYYRDIDEHPDIMCYYLQKAIDDTRDVLAMYMMGMYYYKTQNFESMRVYFEMAATEGYLPAMYKLGKYYRVYAHNYDEMKRYWNAAISAGCGKSAFALGEYFQFTEDDYTGMLWCYNKAIEFGVIAAMYAMAAYHYDITKNYEEMMKYYKMVLDKADRFTPREKMYYANALFDIGTYYRDVECNEELVNSYMIEAFNNGCRDAYEYLPTYFTDELTVFR